MEVLAAATPWLSKVEELLLLWWTGSAAVAAQGAAAAQDGPSGTSRSGALNH
jgi:hypothetical protein